MSEESPESDPQRRLRFLLLAGLMLFFAFVDYLIIGTLEFAGPNPVLTALFTVLAGLLMAFVISALFLLACYASPALGAAVSKRAQYIKDAWIVPMRHFSLGGWNIEGASEHHKFASQRIHARHERRKYARRGARAGADKGDNGDSRG